MCKVRFPVFGLLAVALMFAATARAITLQLSPNSTSNSNPIEADYSNTHLFIDEINGDSIPIYIYFDPQTSGTVDEADVFTNLNNRALANISSTGNGIPDGIVPPDGNNILSSSTTASYYQAYKMNGSGPFNLILYANKTGAYRITARYHLQGDGPNTFHWYSDFIDGNGLNYRDAAVVVSPTKARQMVMYEVNALNVDAEAPANDNDSTTRSTFDYFDNGPNAPQNQTPKQAPRPFNLSYVKSLGVNWLWLQPVHPIGVQGRQSDPNENNAPFSVGSPYSVMDFFNINPLFSKTYIPGVTPFATGEANAMVEFQNFVKAADAAGINIMLDVPFNHTSFDCQFGAIGQTLFGNAFTSSTTQFQNAVANFYSRWNGENVSGADQTSGNYNQYFDYGARAYDAGSIALAADRFDFSKFIDVHDVYFGNYAALVDLNNSAEEDNYLNEGDWFDYSIGPGNVSSDGTDASTNPGNGHFDTTAQNVWKYFAWYIPYWLQQTGHTDANGNLVGNSTLSDPVARRMQDDLGLDGIRADFAQGLPPQCWEYIMNYARSYKWDLVFLAESLDGGHVTYRSSRHFDVVNDNVLFDLYGDQTTSNFRATYDARRSSYGQGLVIWDTESHDEAGYANPYQALIRFAADSTIDGVPDIFYGQEIGISGAVTPPSSNPVGTPYGFTTGTSGGTFSGYQVNFGKPIPNFMCFNSLVNAWNSLGGDAYGQAQLYPVYSAIGNARLSSPALQSSNRYYLNNTGGNINQNIFAVAKYANANAYPNLSDVVFAFVNLTGSSSQSDVFNVNITQNGSNLFGIDPARTYNIKNIAADTEYDSTRNNVWLWGAAGISGSNILNNGIYVALNPVPTSVSGWPANPYEAQYLKLYDITPPPSAGAPSTPKVYAIGSSATFSWTAASDPEGGIAGYQVVVSTAPNGGGTVIFSGTTPANSISVTGTYGQTLYATVTTINNAGINSTAASPSGSGTILLDPNGDANGAGLTNAQEDAAGFNPLDNNNYFHVTSIGAANGGGTQITWASVNGRSYVVQESSGLVSGYTALSGTITATGTSCSYTDTSPPGTTRFYRVSTSSQ
jgi:glycosidase